MTYAEFKAEAVKQHKILVKSIRKTKTGYNIVFLFDLSEDGYPEEWYSAPITRSYPYDLATIIRRSFQNIRPL